MPPRANRQKKGQAAATKEPSPLGRLIDSPDYMLPSFIGGPDALVASSPLPPTTPLLDVPQKPAICPAPVKRKLNLDETIDDTLQLPSTDSSTNNNSNNKIKNTNNRGFVTPSTPSKTSEGRPQRATKRRKEDNTSLPASSLGTTSSSTCSSTSLMIPTPVLGAPLGKPAPNTSTNNARRPRSTKEVPSKMSRYDTSLGLLTSKFIKMLDDSQAVDLNVAAEELGVQKRRVYDITNVLEGIGIIEKKSKNFVKWTEQQAPTQEELEKRQACNDEILILHEQEMRLVESIKAAQESLEALLQEPHVSDLAFLRHSDIEEALNHKLAICVIAPSGTRVELPPSSTSQSKYVVNFKSSEHPIYVVQVDSSPGSDNPCSIHLSGRSSLTNKPLSVARNPRHSFNDSHIFDGEALHGAGEYSRSESEKEEVGEEEDDDDENEELENDRIFSELAKIGNEFPDEHGAPDDMAWHYPSTSHDLTTDTADDLFASIGDSSYNFDPESFLSSTAGDGPDYFYSLKDGEGLFDLYDNSEE